MIEFGMSLYNTTDVIEHNEHVNLGPVYLSSSKLHMVLVVYPSNFLINVTHRSV